MFNSKNPVLMSIVVLVVVMVITMVVLYFVKPKLIIKEDSMKKEVAWDKLVAYSALVGVVVAILALLWCEIMKKGKGMSSFGRKSRFGYCGM
jgi:hypothetical protein